MIFTLKRTMRIYQTTQVQQQEGQSISSGQSTENVNNEAPMHRKLELHDSLKLLVGWH